LSRRGALSAHAYTHKYVRWSVNGRGLEDTIIRTATGRYRSIPRVLDRFGPDIELRETWQGPARHAVCLEKVDLAGGERWARQELAHFGYLYPIPALEHLCLRPGIETPSRLDTFQGIFRFAR